MSVSGYMTLGRNNYMYIDRNMVDDPYFVFLQKGTGVFMYLLLL